MRYLSLLLPGSIAGDQGTAALEMSSKKDQGSYFIWSNETVGIFNEICIQFILKRGRGQQFRWKQIQALFEERTKRKCSSKSLKNKFDFMKKDWRLWKLLKRDEIGLSWNAAIGTLDCSDEWWNKKIKEKTELKKFKHKGIPKNIEEQWDQIFGDSIATGVECVAPSATMEENNNQENHQETVHDNADDYEVYKSCSAQLDEGNLFQNFVHEASANGHSIPTSTTAEDAGTNVISKKRKLRQSKELVKLSEILEKGNTCLQAIERLLAKKEKVVDDCVSVGHVMEIMTRMADNGGLVRSGNLWFHSICVLDSPSRRQFFIHFKDDDERLNWLKFMQAKEMF
ncbi:unnamed protein product [Cuscuta epithymum]|uniref:Myb/SANT-like domain-containing protein n=1 Tax=Cuscuta epithymum TaxID=186058 RepID=A0AAV0DKQ8_9ASTE|nr:unnamed protein product [Cuscuta epithymum]CAH9140777.1 unnamed protein product [Cuscuta epithymum]